MMVKAEDGKTYFVESGDITKHSSGEEKSSTESKASKTEEKKESAKKDTPKPSMSEYMKTKGIIALFEN